MLLLLHVMNAMINAREVTTIGVTNVGVLYYYFYINRLKETPKLTVYWILIYIHSSVRWLKWIKRKSISMPSKKCILALFYSFISLYYLIKAIDDTRGIDKRIYRQFFLNVLLLIIPSPVLFQKWFVLLNV